ncbi:MAG: LPS export ABC transporter periplasmic protein LptC [Alphaproteobacteria bacterium]|nr:LPS export ABC transporter periplasmic protein LptC [Alphaproteobacteria bacterium]
MQKDKRNFIIFKKHRRWMRLWQFFFTGWGLIMVAALVAGALFTKQLLWTPISAINMTDVISNQFKMSGASFAGTDKNGAPFRLRAATARQEYKNPDIIYMDTVSGTITRKSGGDTITQNITARTAQYNRAQRNIRLIGDVRIDSSNGDRILTKELVIKL